MGKLTARQVETLKAPGRHSDGGNLYLNIAKGGSKSWVFFYRFRGTRKEIGLGSMANTSLAEARKKASEAQRLIGQGKDPKTEKVALSRAEASKRPFGSFADEYLAEHIHKFKNKGHRRNWTKTVEEYLAPLRSKALADIDTESVLKVLRPLWQEIPESAAKVRGRLEAIIDAAKVQGLYDGDNPARWKGHLKAVLPARQRLAKGHHAALPYDELPDFLARVRQQVHSVGALALEFCILTATRTGETIGAKWSEFDLARRVWTIPASRMKAGFEHRIPLADRALEILKQLEMSDVPHNEHVFPGLKSGKGLSNMAMSAVLKRMKRRDITVHGFRSSFSDWAAEQTSFSHETREHALAHRISDKADAAYRRGDQFEKRRKLMEAWQAFCESKPIANVVKLKR